ncbi:hypothetical protein HTS88_20955 [Pseudarthrobacter oxydans]|uniref:hypothetical protein n=1 Tax=Pseudarthrobacter oxydans TaxID=1671 RepID=UPI0015749322|nr:hypothetical protein [Pseudarthrobacter oxydans]NSX38851.1 hypothetical protein [Pseudarthrobacter oxydans]
MSILVPQNQLRAAAKTLLAFAVPVQQFGAVATSGLISTVATEMFNLASTQSTIGLHANAVNICRVQTCMENLRAAALVLAEPPFAADGGRDAVDDALTLLTQVNADLLTYDDELKAA